MRSTDLFSSVACFAVQVFVTLSNAPGALIHFCFMSIDGFSMFTENKLLPLRVWVEHSMVAQLSWACVTWILRAPLQGRMQELKAGVLCIMEFHLNYVCERVCLRLWYECCTYAPFCSVVVCGCVRFLFVCACVCVCVCVKVHICVNSILVLYSACVCIYMRYCEHVRTTFY